MGKGRAQITELPNNPNVKLAPDDPLSVYSIVIFDSRGLGVELEACGQPFEKARWRTG